MSSSLSSYESAYTHPLVTSVMDLLMYNEFVGTRILSLAKKEIRHEDVRKCIWLVSILANSKDENHIKRAQIFAALVYLNYSDNIDIARSAYILFSRTGNLTATKFLSILYNTRSITDIEFKYDFGLSLDIEVGESREENTIEISGNKFITTTFQKRLWSELNKTQNVSISGPTSSGKSFIIKKYLEQRTNEKKDFIALYIVPSRALINQVSEELRNDLDIFSVDIRTTFLIEDQSVIKKRKQIYVLTQERCLKLLQYSWNKQLHLDFVFVDEIQNVEEEAGRGTLLEYVLRELSLLGRHTQIVSAGPNISNSKSLFSGVFGANSSQIQTTVSPVFQIRTIVRPENNKINVILKTQDNDEIKLEVKTEVNIKKLFDTSIGAALPHIIKYLGGNAQNIIYSSRTDYVESWALQFVETKIPNEVNDNSILDLVEFLKDEIHPDYYLIPCIMRGVAFHHGKLPDVARKEIEDLFSTGKITNLFCTSTLIEGVNLPANNLFVILPKKRTEYLSNFEFGNLIGRAGRIKDSLYGTVYCIERNDELWADNYYSNTYQKDVITVSEKSLFESDEFINKLELPIESIDKKRDVNTVIFMRHKYLRDKNELDQYLKMKYVNPQAISSMIDVLEKTLKDIVVSAEILKLNPSIDPVSQNILYNTIVAEGITSWVIIPNKNLNRLISRDNKDNFSLENLNLYWQLVNIIEKLDSIFLIRNEAFFKHSISLSASQMCLYGIKWLNSKTYKELINEDLLFHSRHRNPSLRIDINDKKAVNERIKTVINISSTVVSYILVKYLKLLNDHLEPMMTIEQKDLYKFSLALPVMLELGTTEPIIIQLISKGIPRSVAIKIFNILPTTLKTQETDIFNWLGKQTSIGLKPIYERYLQRMKILKVNYDVNLSSPDIIKDTNRIV